MAGAPKRGRGRPRAFDPAQALERARERFWESGYASTSLDDLSAATGVNRPSLYSAFGDKQGMYLAALRKSHAETVAMLAAAMAADEPLRKSLQRVFAGAAHLYLEGEMGQRGCFLIGTAVSEAVGNPEIRRALDQALEELDRTFEARFRRAREAGEIDREADAAALARMATSTLNAMAIRARAGADAQALSRYGKGFVALVCPAPKAAAG